jgi:hypothetical protein
VAELNKALDALAVEGVLSVYVEILRKPGVRQAKPPGPAIEPIASADAHTPAP